MGNDDSAPQVILAGDVGGTHARRALMEAGGEQLKLLNEKIFPSHEYSNLEAIVSAFLAENATKPELAGIGVAGPIRDGKCVATNLPWVVDASTIAVASGLPRVELMNDLEANAFGISMLAASDFCVLQ